MNIFKLTLISLLCLFVFTGCIKKTVVTAGKIVEMAVLLPIAGVAYAVQQAKGEEDTKDKEKGSEEPKPTTNNSNQDVTSAQNNETNKTNDIEQELEPSSTIAQVQVLKEEEINK